MRKQVRTNHPAITHAINTELTANHALSHIEDGREGNRRGHHTPSQTSEDTEHHTVIITPSVAIKSNTSHPIHPPNDDTIRSVQVTTDRFCKRNPRIPLAPPTRLRLRISGSEMGAGLQVNKYTTSPKQGELAMPTQLTQSNPRRTRGKISSRSQLTRLKSVYTIYSSSSTHHTN